MLYPILANHSALPVSSTEVSETSAIFPQFSSFLVSFVKCLLMALIFWVSHTSLSHRGYSTTYNLNYIWNNLFLCYLREDVLSFVSCFYFALFFSFVAIFFSLLFLFKFKTFSIIFFSTQVYYGVHQDLYDSFAWVDWGYDLGSKTIDVNCHSYHIILTL